MARALSDSAKREAHVLAQLVEYLPDARTKMLKWPFPRLDTLPEAELPPRFCVVGLPDWANEFGMNGGLLVPCCLLEDSRSSWDVVPWLDVCFWYLEGVAERAVEENNGPIFSNSNILGEWDPRHWECAWVNRIALFLRRWTARREKVSEESFWGSPPKAKLYLTHDVDAIDKTAKTRLKQCIQMLRGSALLLKRARLWDAFCRFVRALVFLLRDADYRQFSAIRDIESRFGARSSFFFYGGTNARRNLMAWMADPDYRIEELGRGALQGMDLGDRGSWTAGLHQGYGAWKNSDEMRFQRLKVEDVLGIEVVSCRQHWLRFSWKDTWVAQQLAGLNIDSTLGFNDRPGFRNGAALRFKPWGLLEEMPFHAIPMVFMDSHGFDYAAYCEDEVFEMAQRWLLELHAVGGTASIIWHQRTFAEDYSWGRVYERLLEWWKGLPHAEFFAP